MTGADSISPSPATVTGVVTGVVTSGAGRRAWLTACSACSSSWFIGLRADAFWYWIVASSTRPWWARRSPYALSSSQSDST